MPFSYMNEVGEHLSVYQLANDVLRAAYGKANLAIPEICPIQNVNRLHIKQPLMGQVKVNMGVREYESIGTNTPSTTSKNIELLNDRIAVQVSAEAQIENYYGDTLGMIAEEQGQALKKALELWIATALQGGKTDASGNREAPPLKLEANPAAPGGDRPKPSEFMEIAQHFWHHFVVPNTRQMLGVFDPSAVAMNPATWAALQPMFMGAIGADSNTPYQWAKNIPGFECPVTTSVYLPVNKLFVVSTAANAMKCYQYDTMRPVMQYDPAINADTLYAGIWRTVACGFRMATKPTFAADTGLIRQNNPQTGNAGIVEITLGSTFWGGLVLNPMDPEPTDADELEDNYRNYVDARNEIIAEDIRSFATTYIDRQKRIAKVDGNDMDTDSTNAMRSMFGLGTTSSKKSKK